MSIGISPVELNMMAGDFTDLLNGLDANDITMTNETGTPDPVYQGKWVGTPTVNTQTFRAIVVFKMAYRTYTGDVLSGLARRKFAELPDADIALIMPATVQDSHRVLLETGGFVLLEDGGYMLLEGEQSQISLSLKGLVNVVFHIAGLGSYRPLEKPAEDLSQYALLFPAGNAMIQWVFAKAIK